MNRKDHEKSLQAVMSLLQQSLYAAYTGTLHRNLPNEAYVVFSFTVEKPGEITVKNAGYQVSAARGDSLERLDPKALEHLKAGGEPEQIRSMCRSLSFLMPEVNTCQSHNEVAIDLKNFQVCEFESCPADKLTETVRPSLARIPQEVFLVARRISQAARKIHQDQHGLQDLPQDSVLEIEYACSDHADDFGEDVVGFSIKHSGGEFHPETAAQIYLIEDGLGRLVERIRDGLLPWANAQNFMSYPGSNGRITVSLNTGKIKDFEHTKMMVDDLQSIDPQVLSASYPTEGPTPI